MQTELRELLKRAARELDRHLGPGPFNRAQEIRAALAAQDEPAVDQSFIAWMAEHGQAGVKSELGLEELMEGAYYAGAKSNRRFVRAQRKLEIDACGELFACWVACTDGRYQVGPQFSTTDDAVSWCERNGFAWSGSTPAGRAAQ